MVYVGKGQRKAQQKGQHEETANGQNDLVLEEFHLRLDLMIRVGTPLL